MNGISVLIPSYNEEKNIKKVINLIKKNKHVTQIVVINNNSTDRTEAIVRSIKDVELVFCAKQGKGYSMAEGLLHATNDIVMFLDADICNYSNKLIDLLVEPILYKDVDFVKGSFQRSGGRVTELVAKPLLELLFPELKCFDQPLSGTIVGKKSLFEKMKFEKRYGVDVGILIDAFLLNAKMEQVNIGKIKNDSQSWKDLSGMSKQVIKSILKRTRN